MQHCNTRTKKGICQREIERGPIKGMLGTRKGDHITLEGDGRNGDGTLRP